MKTKKALLFGFGFIISLAALVFVSDGQAFAATKTWDGGGGDDNFNTAANWNGDSVPSNGDDLVFAMSTITTGDVGGTQYWTLNNNISSFTVASITFTGTNPDFYRYKIEGNAITVNSAITDSFGNWLNLSITLGGNVTIAQPTGNSGSSIGDPLGSTTLNVGSHTLTVSGDGANCGLTIGSALSGSGAVASALPNGALAFGKAASGFTGAVSTTGGTLGLNVPTALGSTSGVTVSGTGSLGVALSNADQTFNFPLTIGGAGRNGINLFATKGTRTTGCSGGGSTTEKFTATMTGAVSLTSNIVYNGGYVDMKLTGVYVSNGHTISLFGSSTGTITSPDGTAQPTTTTTVIAAGDNQPGVSLAIDANQIYIINGIRGDVGVYDNGILKGSGVVGALNIFNDGRLSPGQSPGCLTANGNFGMGDGYYDAELGGTTVCEGYDQLKVNGTVTLSNDITSGPVLNASIYGTFKPAVGNTFTIIDNDGADAVTGTFQGLAEGATFEVGGTVFRISYVGGDGNDVVLTVLSVPAAPDTGFGLVTSNPLVVLGITSTLAAGIYALYRKQNLLFKK